MERSRVLYQPTDCFVAAPAVLPQAHLSRSPLPISDYVTDTKGVLDNSLRILQVCPFEQLDLSYAPCISTVVSNGFWWEP
jgi:hypothetical protein